jgi:hypothetical protein
MKAFLAALILARLIAPATAQTALPRMPVPDRPSCGPVNGLSFVCGPRRPEDAIPLPGTRWLLISGMTPGSGLGVIDTNSKTAYFLYATKSTNPPDRLYASCPAAPDPASFAAHGIHVRKVAPGRYLLYVVSHGPLESVQIFDLDTRGDFPAVSWKGCVPMLDNHPGNSVVSFSDGSMLVTVLGGLTMGDVPGGKPIGAVFSWSPRDKTFHWLKGTELAAPNGIESSKDEKEFYVVSTNDLTVHVFSRDGRELRAGATPGVFGDNIRWNGDRLVIAGMTYDEPACGGMRQFGGVRTAAADCHRGYVVGEVDPVSLHWKVISYGEPNPVFDAVAAAAIVGDTLWLTTWKSDRIAYRPLPGLTTP